jgi:hypothetical protein
LIIVQRALIVAQGARMGDRHRADRPSQSSRTPIRTRRSTFRSPQTSITSNVSAIGARA